MFTGSCFSHHGETEKRWSGFTKIGTTAVIRNDIQYLSNIIENIIQNQ